jgi:hypothetical protein
VWPEGHRKEVRNVPYPRCFGCFGTELPCHDFEEGSIDTGCDVSDECFMFHQIEEDDEELEATLDADQAFQLEEASMERFLMGVAEPTESILKQFGY